MEWLLVIGLVLSLFGAFALLVVFKLTGLDSLHYYPRISLWILGFSVVVLAYMETELWMEQLGLTPFGWIELVIAGVAFVVMLVSWPLLQQLQKVCGGVSTEQSMTFAYIMEMSFLYRLFLVVTAAVTEEVLYRGYAIGIGQLVFGDIWLASVISIAVFTFGHIRWGLSHLITVFWFALVLSFLFVYTQNLWACIIAHVCIDSIGFLLAPAIAARRNERAAS